jgi:disulfide bond formation protein DsbB
VSLLSQATPIRAALGVLVLGAATIGGAWAFQFAGYAPCELCLQQRWAYYAGLPLAALAAACFAGGARRAGLVLLALTAAIFLANGVFAAWHAGVEWGFWPGPSGCTGSAAAPVAFEDFLKSVEQTRLVRCDEVAIRILGLSLAGWNALICLALAALAGAGARSAARAAA